MFLLVVTCTLGALPATAQRTTSVPLDDSFTLQTYGNGTVIAGETYYHIVTYQKLTVQDCQVYACAGISGALRNAKEFGKPSRIVTRGP
ncbi:MAG: hypothetical protein AAFY49_05155 [Pseudomonadota bacterium]